MNDIKQEYEQELIFQVEPENKNNKEAKTKKIARITSENLKVLVLDRLNGRTGDC